ncbi:MAG: protein kinase [Gemmatimonadaceae bacterium]|nr:protein kinase [Gemmatimonadaceae bacterium]
MTDLLSALRASLGDKYRIDRELGGGGMSRVFVAEEIALGRQVVLKVLPTEMAATVNSDRFRQEVQFAARLQHPHIVPVLATGEDAGTLWYSMPFVSGESLRARLTGGALSIRDALGVWREMLDALAHAHKAGLIHRDIKPDNVLISGRHALVTDFGIAKAMASATNAENGSSLTGIGFVVGTPAYMAPEQAAGMSEVDQRTDVYSAALVAYEMFTGKAPFGELTASQALASQVQVTPAAPRTLRAELPAGIDALLMQCLAKDPAGRPSSADAVLEALDVLEAAGGLSASTTGGSPVSHTALALAAGRRRKWYVGGAVLATMVAAVIWRNGRPGSASETGAARDLVLVASFSHEAADSSVARAITEALRIDLQQSNRLRAAEPQMVRTTLQTMRLAPDAELTDSLARAVGQRTGAKAFINGALSKLGTGYVLTARLVSVADGVEVAALRETARDPSQLLDATDRLSKAIRQKAGESVASLRGSSALPSVTTTSFAALERYAAGIELMRQGQQLSAAGEFEKAIALDSVFASAWVGLSTSLGNAGIRLADRTRAVTRAYDLRQKLVPVERLRVESRYHSARGEFTEEVAAYRALLAIDPTNYAALNNLGRQMLARGRFADAESLFKAAVVARPGSLAPLEMLQQVAVARADTALMDSLRRTIPKGEIATRLEYYYAEKISAAAGEYSRLAAIVDSTLASKPDPEFSIELLRSRSELLIMRGRLRVAENEVQRVVRPLVQRLDPTRMYSIDATMAEARLVLLDDTTGARRGLSRIDSALVGTTVPREDQAFLYRAFLHARTGNVRTARQMLAEAGPLLPRDTTWTQWINGEIALAEKRPLDAIGQFRRVVGAEQFCLICGSGALARAFDAAGMRDSVVAVYERSLASRVPADRTGEDVMERARALKRLGELYEDRGNLVQAIRRYREFVELWKDADAELQPVVADVRERIVRLEAKRG